MQCVVMLLLGAPTAFVWAYTFLFAFNAAYLALALVKWYREIRALDLEPAR